MTKILVTGGAGFIGSHTCIELLNNGNEVVVVDNLYNASKKSLEVVERVTGKKVTFYEVDIRDEEKLNEVFEKEQIMTITLQELLHFVVLWRKTIVKTLSSVLLQLYTGILIHFLLERTSHYQ